MNMDNDPFLKREELKDSEARDDVRVLPTSESQENMSISDEKELANQEDTVPVEKEIPSLGNNWMEVDNQGKDLIDEMLDEYYCGLSVETSGSKVLEGPVERRALFQSLLDKFPGINHVDLYNRLMEGNRVDIVIENFEKFPNIDHIDLANRIIEKAGGKVIADNLEKFKGLDHVGLANRLIDEGQGELVAANLEKFKGLDHVDLANRLVEKGGEDSVVNN